MRGCPAVVTVLLPSVEYPLRPGHGDRIPSRSIFNPSTRDEDLVISQILSPNHRVVGVVINAIDDRLSSAEQIRDDWTLNRISPLGSLLKLARDSGRVVILASDF